MIEFITEYWLEALFGVILTGLLFMVKRLFRLAKNARCETHAVRTGIKCMLRDRIINCHEKYIQLKYCPIAIRDSLEDMFMAYKTLGGNGAINHIVTELNDLPTIRKGDKE